MTTASFLKTRANLELDLAATTILNSDKCYEFKSRIEKYVDHLIEDLDRVSAKYWATYRIGSKFKPTEARKKKGNKRRITASNNRMKKACVLFRSLGGKPRL